MKRKAKSISMWAAVAATMRMPATAPARLADGSISVSFLAGGLCRTSSPPARVLQNYLSATMPENRIRSGSGGSGRQLALAAAQRAIEADGVGQAGEAGADQALL